MCDLLALVMCHIGSLVWRLSLKGVLKMPQGSFAFDDDCEWLDDFLMRSDKWDVLLPPGWLVTYWTGMNTFQFQYHGEFKISIPRENLVGELTINWIEKDDGTWAFVIEGGNQKCI